NYHYSWKNHINENSKLQQFPASPELYMDYIARSIILTRPDFTETLKAVVQIELNFVASYGTFTNYITGFLVSPLFVFTAGHSVYEANAVLESIRVYSYGVGYGDGVKAELLNIDNYLQMYHSDDKTKVYLSDFWPISPPLDFAVLKLATKIHET